MTKIDVFSGFLGAGKTTLIKKLISEAYAGEKLVLIENEFGETGIDGGFLKESGIQINEMNSGCICCSLVGDFTKALAQVIDEYNPDRILIEPSGVGKLSDVIKAVKSAENNSAVLGSTVAVVDANKCKMYIKNFGEFFIDQVENADTIILSRTADISEEKLHNCISLLRQHNGHASIITTDWKELDGKQILLAMENTNSIEKELAEMAHEHEHHHEHKHHHEHEHHHEHDEHCTCGCHEHGHEHHHHHADEVFTSWGIETAHKFTAEVLKEALHQLDNQAEYGFVLRAKGIVPLTDGSWAYFDYVPGECEIRKGSAEVTGKICVIGSNLNKEKLPDLFGIQ